MNKTTPIRTCIVTRKKRPKSELIRLVKTEQGGVQVDIKGKRQGRGANITPDMEVLETAFEKGVIIRALGLKKPLTEKEKQKLKKDFQNAIEEKNFRPQNKNVSIRISKKDLEKVKKS